MRRAILVGDIGGTNARFAEAIQSADGSIEIGDIAILKGDDFSGFEAALAHHINGQNGQVFDYALFAIAGPVRNNRIEMTNRDWVIDGDALAGKFGFRSVCLVNDYAAMARAVPELPDEKFKLLHKGEPTGVRAPIAVAGPGTGLGVATLVPVGEDVWTTVTGQGGHAAYAPRTEQEWALCQRLTARFGYVSKELVLSGVGMDAVHEALCDMAGLEWQKTPPGDLIEAAKAGPGIAQDLCMLRARATLDALGDLALTNGTTGGAVITGGVSLRLLDWLEAPESLARFFERGPMSEYMLPIPIRILLSGEAALIGAAALFFDQEARA